MNRTILLGMKTNNFDIKFMKIHWEIKLEFNYKEVYFGFLVVLLFYVAMESQAIRFVICVVACAESCWDRDPSDEAGLGGGSVGSVTETEHQGHRALLP